MSTSRHFPCGSVLLAISFLLLVGCATTGDQVEAETYIRQAAKQWAESMASGDTSVCERILADDFIGVSSSGKQYNKNAAISNSKTGPKTFASNTIGKVTVRFFGDTAVAQGEEHWVRRNGDTGRFVWTDTWIKRNGSWQIVAVQDVSIKDPPAKP